MNAMKWNDLDKDPAPQWVGDMAFRESQFSGEYAKGIYDNYAPIFKALCKRIYKHETPPVDPVELSRMTEAIAAYEDQRGFSKAAECVRGGVYKHATQAALNAWNQIVAS